MRLGDFVDCIDNRLGTGSLVGVEGSMALVEYFDSIASSHIERVPTRSVGATTPQPQTRCYWRADGHWRIGRIQERSDDDGFLVTEHQKTHRVLTRDLRVRWARSLTDPIEVLIAGGSESPLFHRSRLPFVRSVLRQRAVSRGLSGVLSSRVELHRHQIETARRVLEDPIPRYLLADEVGLGKTIETGFIIRQFLLDNADGRVLVLAPPYLVEQWREELESKFALEDFDDEACEVMSFDDDALEGRENLGMLVVDEAHHLARDSRHSDLYERIRTVAHSTPRLLLLSATPVLHNEEAFLALLHLLDPRAYALDQVDVFRAHVLARKDLGRLLLSLQESTPWYYLPEAAEALSRLFSEDTRLARLLGDLTDDPEHAPEEARRTRVRAVRVHLSETHRVYRRLLRTRRNTELDETFPARGRRMPDFLPTSNAVRIAADRWLEEWRDGMLLEAARTAQSNDEVWLERVFSLFLERTNCSLEALVAAVRFRLGESSETRDADLSERDAADLRGRAPTDTERAQLGALLGSIDPSEDGRIASTVELVGKAPRSDKIVVFCSFAVTARSIASALVANLGPACVEIHIHEMPPPAAAESVRRFRADPACRVLICDRSAEEGQNLQFASRVFHFDLPINPNRLEQRLGRLDRYGIGCVVPSVVPLDSGDSPTFHDAWARSLADDFRIFEGSIAMYQFAVDTLLPGMLRRALQEGAQGFPVELPTKALIGTPDTSTEQKGRCWARVCFDDIVEANGPAGIATTVLGSVSPERKGPPPVIPLGELPNGLIERLAKS